MTWLSATASTLCIPAYLRGLAYFQLKKGDLAAAEFRKVLDHSGVVQGLVTGVLSILQLGRAQVLMHDEEAAGKSYEDFPALWKNADPDLPIYKEAKAEYSALRLSGDWPLSEWWQPDLRKKANGCSHFS